MTIINLKISNYRNLGGLEFNFNDRLNFIIGENNLGKSNLIDLLDVLFNFTRFLPPDFNKIDKPIEIRLVMRLSCAEQKIFTIEDEILSVDAVQKTADSNIIYTNTETNVEIFPEQIRSANFFRYDFMHNQALDLSLVKFKDAADILEYYKNEYGVLNNLSSSDKILIMVELSIISEILKVSKTRKTVIDNAIENTESGFPILLAFDELEMHLSPYMQRSLVRHLNKIMTNENPFFLSVLQKKCNIEKFTGQLFIVTHSPNILLNDYKQFIRFYSIDNVVNVVCGENINVKHDKHLFKNFIYFKEAFFAKSVIVVEGDTEFAALPVFAEKILDGHGFDTYGVSVIKADGKSSVNLVMKILKAFKINNVGMVDRDDDEQDVIEQRLKAPPYLYTTHFRDFEEELLEQLSNKNYCILDEFLFNDEYHRNSSFARLLCDSLTWTKKSEKYNLNLEYFYKKGDSLAFNDYIDNKQVMKLFYITELNRRKGVSFWHELGFELGEQFIPNIYKTVIRKAVSG